jgi:hypothetical protein
MTRPATNEEIRDVREAVIAENAPLVSVSAETGGKYGFYMVLKFEDGWSDIEKQFDIASSLQMQLGGNTEEKNLYYE